MDPAICPACGTENQPGSRFCNQCGTTLDASCASCGAVNPPASRFCNTCGSPLAGAPTPQPAKTGAQQATTAPSRSQRRLVSVLFSDLVGFTAFSESRDPEDVRSFLTSYFDRSREVVERFGGTIEKFIGDAVMAVWGTVEARENDAERAVRAGLELVDMVEALGRSNDVPELKLRVGVLTGETSVGPGGNESTGMIVGDLVNSASRLQASAEAGTVLVGETTQRLTSASIQYEPAGTKEMKGKTEAIAAYRALRVIAQRQGRGAAEGLEPPFVGRDDEFRFLKDQLHATGRDKGARLVSVVGDPGIGKTRITWELQKYIDGLNETFYWHHGRSPDYGESLTFWALAEMVRQRAGIAELDDPAKSRMKLRTIVAQYAPSEEDQRWIEPRLAGLLGLEEMPAGERGEMFAAIRTFFQRIADLGTTVLVFEDLHWADDGLVDFITELVERSARHPILVITLARPDVLDRYPGWGSGRRNSVSMQLAPLTEASMRELVQGTLPGIADHAVETIISRAGGVPLYAVEFIRMLMSSGDVTRSEDGRFELVGSLDGLAVPETVQAVIGSRLDRLDPDLRGLIEDAAVLGQSFTPAALAGLRGVEVGQIRESLMLLVRDELLEFEEDPRSPERGQFRFVQGLIREVSYGRLSREDRADRHLRVAQYFETIGDIELAAALATHYMAAYEASGGDSGLVARAHQALIDAAQRAADLHAHRQSMSLLTKALEISPDEISGAATLEHLAEIAYSAGDNEASVGYALDAMGRYQKVGNTPGIHTSATLAARAYASAHRYGDAQALLEPLYDPDSDANDMATLQLELELARSHMAGNSQRSLDIAERALARDRGVLPMATLVDGIINRGNALAGVGRVIEGRALMRGVIDIADDLGLGRQAIRAVWNLSVFYQFDNLKLSHSMMSDVLERARRIGDQLWVYMALDALAIGSIGEGRFAEAADILSEFDEPDVPAAMSTLAETTGLLVRLYQNGSEQDFAAARTLVDQNNADADMASSRELAHAELDIIKGDFAHAASRVIVYSDSPSAPLHKYVGAMWIGDQAGISQAITEIEAGPPGRYVTALSTLLRACLAADGGQANVALFRHALDGLAQFAPAIELAMAQALFARTLGLDHPDAAGAAAAAHDWFESVGAHQMMEAFSDALPAPGVAATGT